MSGADMDQVFNLAPAEDVEAAASDWLARRVSDGWSEADEAALAQWFAQSPAHRIAFLRLEAAWNYTSRLGALRHPARRRAVGNAAPARSRLMLRVAAAIVMVVAAGIGATAYFSTPREKVYTTAVGGHEMLKLADGSQIELNTDTVLRLTYDAHVRKAVLDRGEAYFQIAHDASRPFSVQAGNRRVTDLGTKFLIRRGSGGLEVAVTEGLVRLEATGAGAHAKPALLSRGDVVVVAAHSMVRTRKPAQKLADELGWRRGVLVFGNATIADAVAQFNRYNTKKLAVAPSAAHIAIGGTFPANNIEAFTELAQDVLGLRIEDHGDEILITR
jgi:transmembrane sensor